MALPAQRLHHLGRRPLVLLAAEAMAAGTADKDDAKALRGFLRELFPKEAAALDRDRL